MEKKDYFALCEKYALLKDWRGVVRDKRDAETCLVKWEGENSWIMAYPDGCFFRYAVEGKDDARRAVPRYWASLKLYDTLASVSVPLSQVEPLQKKGD